MFRFWGIILSLTFGIITIEGSGSECLGRCSPGEPEIFPHKYCNMYCKCMNGVPIPVPCYSINYFFKGHCLPPSLIQSISGKLRCLPPTPSTPLTSSASTTSTTLPTIRIVPPTRKPFTDTPSTKGCIGTCPLKSGHVHYLRHEDCNKFCACTSGISVLHKCNIGEHFSMKLEYCTHPCEADCQDKDCKCIGQCLKEDDPLQAILLAHHDCNKYCLCKQGHPVIKDCPVSTDYSAEKAMCLPRDQVECDRNNLIIPSIAPDDAVAKGCRKNCPKDVHQALVVHTDCSKYCHCRAGASQVKQCASGAFSVDEGRCLARELVECKGINAIDDTSLLSSFGPNEPPPTTLTGSTYTPTFNTKPVSSSSTNPTVSDAIANGCVSTCPKGIIAAYIAHQDCQKYCTCFMELPEVIDCSPGLHYVDKEMSCVDPEVAQCKGLNGLSPNIDSEIIISGFSTTPTASTRSAPSITPTVTASSASIKSHSTSSVLSGSLDNDPIYKSGDKAFNLPHKQGNEFCKCNWSVPVVMDGSDNLLVNHSLQECNWSWNVTCESSDSNESVIDPAGTRRIVDETNKNCIGQCPKLNSMNYTVHLPHKECNKFCKCNWGKPVVMDCPDGLLFNHSLQICDWSWNVTCGSSDSNESVIDSAETRKIVDETDKNCIGQCPKINTMNYTIHLPHKECNKFCKCNWGKPVVMDCPDGLLFNRDLEVCVWPANATCVGDSPTGTDHSTPVPERRGLDPEDSEGTSTTVVSTVPKAVAVKSIESKEVTEATVPIESEEVTETIYPIECEEVTVATVPIESEEVIESIEPIESEEVTEAIDPIESEEVTESIEPIESEKVTEATVPIESEEVIEFIEPDESKEVTEALVPIESEEVTETIDPIESEEVTEATASIESEEVTESIEPIESEKVTEATVPIESEEVIEPIEPIESEEVTKATVPIESEEVIEPIEPIESEEVTEATVPIESEEVIEPIEPIESEEVTEATVPIESEEVIETIEPIEFEEVTQNTVPIESEEVTQNTVPIESEEVTETIDPTEPKEVAETVDPTGSGELPDLEESIEYDEFNVSEDLNKGCLNQCPEYDSPFMSYQLPHKDCTKYCECKCGSATVMKCSSESHFNPVMLVCDTPYYAGCTGIGSLISNSKINTRLITRSLSGSTKCLGRCPIYNDLDKITYLPHEEANKFCRCHFGIPLVAACATGSYFYPKLGTCQSDIDELDEKLESMSLEYNDDTSLGPRFLEPFLATLRDEDECMEKCPDNIPKDRTIYLPHQDCQKVCKCVRGKKVHVLKCANDFSWNPQRQECDVFKVDCHKKSERNMLSDETDDYYNENYEYDEQPNIYERFFGKS